MRYLTFLVLFAIVLGTLINGSFVFTVIFLPFFALTTWYVYLKATEHRYPRANQVVHPPNTRTIPQNVKIAVSVRDGGRCRKCGSTQDLQYDHIYPYSRGGRATVDNIQLLCKKCNLLKSNKVGWNSPVY